MKCHFCNYDVTLFKGKKYNPLSTFYHCPVCGEIKLTEEAVDDFPAEQFSNDQKRIFSGVLRNDYERRGRKPSKKPIELDDLYRMLEQYRDMDPLEKMDHVLITVDQLSPAVGQVIRINNEDRSLFYCNNFSEVIAYLNLLIEQDLLRAQDPANPHNKLWITAKGYQRLRDLKVINKESNICFVAMWFNPSEMGEVYEKAIQPAIEFKENGSSEPRFKAIKIDNVEHINDINDEIIATIRRSRFMVCDLTGYRGGVYFEAGFAYGLGLPVIYTSRKDWTKEQILRTKDKKKIKELYDENMKPIRIRKEGVHFDLAHRNRIDWEPDKLGEFKTKLENRIRAVIP